MCATAVNAETLATRAHVEQQVPAEFTECFESQKAAYLADPVPSYEQRVRDLRAMHSLLKDTKDQLIEAINADFGCRSTFET